MIASYHYGYIPSMPPTMVDGALVVHAKTDSLYMREQLSYARIDVEGVFDDS